MVQALSRYKTQVNKYLIQKRTIFKVGILLPKQTLIRKAKMQIHAALHFKFGAKNIKNKNL